MVSEEEQQHRDRKAWEAAVESILGNLPEQAVGDEAERMAAALRAVSSLMGRLSPRGDADLTKAA